MVRPAEQLMKDAPPNENARGHQSNIRFKPDCDDERRFELYLLDEDEKKVEQKDETRKLHPYIITSQR
jgi:hypothetical protein